jgi:hypothetical protein
VRTSQLASQPYIRWKLYSDRLRQDPSLVAYYTFDNQPEAPDRVLNRSARNQGRFDATIANASWTQGRFPGKASLRFSGSASSVDLKIPQTLRDLTFAAWVNADGFDQRFSGLLMSNGYSKEEEVHWEFDMQGTRLELGHLWDNGKRSPSSALPANLAGNWVHLAATYNHAAGQVSFYLNGSEIGSENVPWDKACSLGAARIGSWNSLNSAGRLDPDRGFRGRFDELAIFSRALPAAEIAAMYSAERADR